MKRQNARLFIAKWKSESPYPPRHQWNPGNEQKKEIKQKKRKNRKQKIFKPKSERKRRLGRGKKAISAAANHKAKNGALDCELALVAKTNAFFALNGGLAALLIASLM